MSELRPTSQAVARKARPGRSTDRGRRVLILPRTCIIQRLFILPTCDPREVDNILKYRIPSETPFLPEQVAWCWTVVDHRSDGNYLVRVDLVEKGRIQGYLSDCAVRSDIEGAIVEDEFLTIWQTRQGAATKQAHERSPAEVHLYRHQNRWLSVLASCGQCVLSNVLAANETDLSEASVGQLIESLHGTDSMPFLAPAADGTRIRSQEGIDVPLPPSMSPASADLESPFFSQHGASAALSTTPLESGGWILSLGSLKDRGFASRLRAVAKRDLLPESWRAQAAGRRTISGLLILTAVSLVVAFLFSLVAGQLETRVRDARLAIDGTRELLKDDLEEVQAAQQLIERVATWSSTGRMVLGVWDRVSAVMPTGVVLSGMTIRDDGAMAIHGTAPDREKIVTLMDELRSDPSGRFEKVILGGLEERNKRQAFEVSARITEGTEASAP